MRAHLARRVHNVAIRSRQLPNQAGSRALLTLSRRTCLTSRPSRSRTTTPLPIEFRRSFLGLFQNPPREIKAAEVEPGWSLILQWRAAVLDNVRPPPREVLIRAVENFFTYKRKYNIAVNSTQALHCHSIFQYLFENKSQEGGGDVPIAILSLARNALLRPPSDHAANHLVLSRALYAEIQRQKALPSSSSPTKPTSLTESPAKSQAGSSERDFHTHIKTLTRYGASKEAASLLHEFYASATRKQTQIKPADQTIWLYMLRGLAREGLEEELCQQVELAQRLGFAFDRGFHEVMTTFYAKRADSSTHTDTSQDIAETKKWFSKPIDGGQDPSPRALDTILKFAINHKEADWVRPTFEALCAQRSQPVTATALDVVLKWVLSVQGSTLDQAMEMIKDLRQKSDIDEYEWPSVDTFNGLLQTALDIKDTSMASQVMKKAQEHSITANATTYSILMHERMNVDDLPGALDAYRDARNIFSTDYEELSVMNAMLRRLCDAPKPDFDTLTEITTSLADRGATLEPQTVCDLCSLYLRFERPLDVMDTLSLNLFQYSLQEQEVVETTVLNYCLDKSINTSKAWDSYEIFHQFFVNASIATRMRIVLAFFDRRRPDMAMKVFGHMRGHVSRRFHPDQEAFIQFFERLGSCPHSESLRIVHNMLKLDHKIQPTTRLYNSLMMAYLGQGWSNRAVDFWRDITHSIEGPSYKSLEIIFAVLAKRPHGDSQARSLWRKLKTMDVDVTPAIYVRYAAAISINNGPQESMALLEGMKEAVGQDPDAVGLGIVHNALSGPLLQKQFESWAAIKFPEAMAELTRIGKTVTADYVMRYKIPYTLQA